MKQSNLPVQDIKEILSGKKNVNDLSKEFDKKEYFHRWIHNMIHLAVQGLKTKEFLEFAKKLEPVTPKTIWADLIMEAKRYGILREDKQQSGTDQVTGNYHKNLAIMARLSEGADFSEWDKSHGLDPTLEFGDNIKSRGRTSTARHNAEKYRSGVVKADRIAAATIAKLKLMKDKQNA
ncbi:MAG: hypothetical protein WC137_01020 [Alphaproteobacteria bacterium]